MPPTKVLISYTAQKHKIKTRATQKSLPFGKWRFRENVLGRMGQRQNRIRQKEQQDYAEEQKRRYGIKKKALRFQTGGERHQKSPVSLSGVRHAPCWCG